MKDAFSDFRSLGRRARFLIDQEIAREHRLKSRIADLRVRLADAARMS